MRPHQPVPHWRIICTTSTLITVPTALMTGLLGAVGLAGTAHADAVTSGCYNSVTGPRPASAATSLSSVANNLVVLDGAGKQLRHVGDTGVELSVDASWNGASVSHRFISRECYFGDTLTREHYCIDATCYPQKWSSGLRPS